MSEDPFVQAVALAREIGQLFDAKQEKDLKIRAESAEEYLMFHALGFQWCGPDKAPHTRAEPEVIEMLLEMAETNSPARNLLRQHLIRKLTHLVTLSAPESRAAAIFLDDGFPVQPARSGPKQARYFERDFHIYILARDMVERFGLTLIRNDESQIKRSACDAISEGFSEAGATLTFDAVKTIVYRRDLKANIEKYMELMTSGKIR